MDTSDSESEAEQLPPPPPKSQSRKQPREQPPPPRWSDTLTLVVNAALEGDRINLPSSSLDQILSLSGPNQLPSPLFFKLTNHSTSQTAYATVREFTSPTPTTAEISPFLATLLQIPSTTTTTTTTTTPNDTNEPFLATIECTSLPHCTFLKLSPNTPEYLQIPDLRPVLEGFLRGRFSTITTGTTLLVQGIEFLVVETRPGVVCSCVDVDVDLEVVPIEGGVAEAAVREKYFGGGGSSGGGGVVDVGVGSGVLGRVGGGGDVFYGRVKVGDEKGGVWRVTVGGEGGASSSDGGELGVFVSTRGVEKPGMWEHDWFSVEGGVVDFVVGGNSQDEQEEEDVGDVPYVYITVTLLEDARPRSIRVTVEWNADGKLVEEQNSVPLQAPIDEPIPEGHIQCDNCFQTVPTRTHTMHQAFCLRNNTVCTRCRTAGSPNFIFKKQDFPHHWHCDLCPTTTNSADPQVPQKHMQLYHTVHTCTCGTDLELRQVGIHQRRDCPDRIIICRYCRLRVKAGRKSTAAKDLYAGLGLSEHESVCGSRTIECIKCRANVQLKDVKMHAQFHEVQKQTQKTPALCPNSQCAHRPNAQFPNPLGLCQTCFSPFWSPTHDPGNQKLAAKLLQKYHSQLTNGCGRTGVCQNTGYCATAKGPDGAMDATGAALVAFEVLKKSALFSGGLSKAEYHLCVSEAKNAKRRADAATLAEMGFHISWAVKGLEESGDSVERALQWLLQNAPKI
ncbi:hypothetical protein HDU79_006173 [Rhizoclosmatium sp. JEL0117]|nr:hypothetical protein HDU79_006173 [Rhizoclosmatium sp. JEL0117]